MKGLRPARIALALLPCLVWSQHSSEPEPARFEAEVIVPSDPASVDVWLVPQAGGGLRAENVAVWQLIKTAYYIRDEQLEGGPSWVRSQRYDIVAGPAKSDGITSNLAQHRLRMQALLRDRFALTLRTESRVKRFYSLKLSELGLKMRQESEGNPVARMRDGQLSVTTDAQGIAALLTDVIGTTVIDETGLRGNFKVNLEWTPGASGEDALIAAVREQMGLDLEPKTGRLPVFVIERIEKPARTEIVTHPASADSPGPRSGQSGSPHLPPSPGKDPL